MFFSRVASTAPRKQNVFSLNIHDLEGIEAFFVFEKKKSSIDARFNNMGSWLHNFGSFVHVFEDETI